MQESRLKLATLQEHFCPSVPEKPADLAISLSSHLSSSFGNEELLVALVVIEFIKPNYESKPYDFSPELFQAKRRFSKPRTVLCSKRLLIKLALLAAILNSDDSLIRGKLPSAFSISIHANSRAIT